MTANAIEAALSHLGAKVLMVAESPWDTEVPGAVLWATQTGAVAKASPAGVEYGVHGFFWREDVELPVLTSGTYTADLHEACREFASRCATYATSAVYSDLRQQAESAKVRATHNSAT